MVTAEYDARRAAEIARWAADPPGLVARGFGRALGPASRAMQEMIPVGLLRQVLQGSHSLARLQFHHRLPQPVSGANLHECEQRARRVEKLAMSLAGGVGAATGLGGALALSADISAVLTLALATIERTAHCYGLGPEALATPQLAIGIFALASANTPLEKRQALQALDSDPEQLWVAAARDGLERAAQRQMARESVHLTLAQVARQLGPVLGQRKLGQTLPLIGSAVGLTVNALYVRDVARTAQNVFALRYLIQHAEPADLARLRPPPRPAPPPEIAGSSATSDPGRVATRESSAQ